MRPNDRSYLESHEWAKLDGDVVTIGVTDFAIEQLGELVYLDLPEVGRALQTGEAFGEVESVKAVSDLNSPAAGEIVEVNSELADQLDRLHADPFDAGWLLKIKVADTSFMDGLHNADSYQSLVEANS